ncbi:uncharacterized protein EDB91DRAFT_737689 [Suillus paluster]|uniref:uncharacterized protein n=1 Tax=Suillus paluster TaxID=48578 RepID=UPI001B86C0E9|nr:uncharacterized protein EDB91DRAFT_737689 [Suillus paluster]KAG1730952.1 hypothetical protein EDB91DRAFT_737689 [Suillus paluster]
MTLLPCAVLLCLPFVYASLPSLNDSSVHTLDAASGNCATCPHARILPVIIWSCTATLFACAWTAVHPNIPGVGDGKFAIASRRLLVMVMVLIAPELIITWAAAQFFSARAAAKDFNDCAFGAQRAQVHDDYIPDSTAMLLSDIQESDGRHNQSRSAPRPAKFAEWKLTHGFFAWMGGFMLYVDDKPRAPLTPTELLHFVRERYVDMPIITEADIEDKSKDDGLSKAIAIIELVWFVLQLIARFVQKLPITLLEIDTLAVTALICFSYCVWWKKPKDVRRPCIVHWKPTAPPSGLTYDEADSRFSNGFCSPFIFRFIYPLLSSMGMGIIISPGAAHSRRVPTLGGYGEHRDDVIQVLVGACSAAAFGSIHLLGCKFLTNPDSDSASDLTSDQLLWFLASAAMGAVAPLFFALVFGLKHSLRKKRVIDATRQEITIPFLVRSIIIYYYAAGAVIYSLIYIPARVVLVVLIIRDLALLPPTSGVYDTVAWIRFIPHL